MIVDAIVTTDVITPPTRIQKQLFPDFLAMNHTQFEGMPVSLNFHDELIVGHIVHSQIVNGAWHIRMLISALDRYAAYVASGGAQLSVAWDIRVVHDGLAKIARYDRRVTSFSIVRKSLLTGASWLPVPAVL